MAKARYVVKEKSYIDGHLRQAGDVVDIDLGCNYDPKAHANLAPFSKKALQDVQSAINEKKGGDADADSDADE